MLGIRAMAMAPLMARNILSAMMDVDFLRIRQRLPRISARRKRKRNRWRMIRSSSRNSKKWRNELVRRLHWPMAVRVRSSLWEKPSLVMANKWSASSWINGRPTPRLVRWAINNISRRHLDAVILPVSRRFQTGIFRKHCSTTRNVWMTRRTMAAKKAWMWMKPLIRRSTTMVQRLRSRLVIVCGPCVDSPVSFGLKAVYILMSAT
mmetsp:Transcript_54860/g.91029  ORF Transcript_54860/g.91029 Transcript_54860/m.91029 type:complete len:206 (-) Transcript_54860:387-1004(-)